MSKLKMLGLGSSKGMAEPSTRSSYQSVWMAHWKVTKLSPNSKSEFSSLNYEAREIALDSTSGLEMTSSLSDVPNMDNHFCKVPAKNTVNVMDLGTTAIDIVEGKTVAIASQYLTEEGPISEAWTPLAMHSFPKNRIEGSADGLKQPFESENFVGKKSIVFSVHYEESPLRSSSRQVTRGLDAEGNLHAFSPDKVDRQASMTTPSLWSRAASLLQNDYTPTGQKRLLTCLSENSREAHHQTLPSQRSPLEAIKCKAICYENSSRPSHNVVDVMATRTHTFVDPTERLTAGQIKFSQTRHQLIFSEKTDTHMSKRGRTFRESAVHANYPGNSTFGQFLSLSTDGNYHGNPGVKLKPLWSSTDSEGPENLADVKTSAIAAKNESSAETNTLDMNALSGKHLSGEAPSLPEKDASAGKGSCSLAKVGSRERKRKFLTLVTISSSTEDGEPSPSKTQSLVADHLLPRDDQGSRSNPEAHSSGCREPEQRDGRMKHLKASDSDQHRESLKLGDASPVKKVNDLFGRISTQMKDIFRPGRADTLGKQIAGLGERARPAKGGLSTSGDKKVGGKGRGALLSDPWIRRWCHHKTAAVLQKKQEPFVMHEPFGAKAFDELPKKQLPSIAAMALMGKAMIGFRPCEFTRRGSLVVWNS